MINCTICNNNLIGNQKKFCSIKCKNKQHQGDSQKKRGLLRKVRLISMFNNRCKKCGYNKNLSALSFHHTQDKQFQLGLRKISNSKWSDLVKEVQKCELLCSNCHMEEHNPHLDLDKL
jgi:hypothetical protein